MKRKEVKGVNLLRRLRDMTWRVCPLHLKRSSYRNPSALVVHEMTQTASVVKGRYYKCRSGAVQHGCEPAYTKTPPWDESIHPRNREGWTRSIVFVIIHYQAHK